MTYQERLEYFIEQSSQELEIHIFEKKSNEIIVSSQRELSDDMENLRHYNIMTEKLKKTK